MANGNDDPRIYQALALPEQALENGGLEILRLGIVNDELYVSALPAFKNPGQWGEVLADIAWRIGAIYAAQNPGLTKKDVTVQIVEAFATDMGAVPAPAKAKTKSSGTKTTVKKVAKKAAKKVAKQPARKKR